MKFILGLVFLALQPRKGFSGLLFRAFVVLILFTAFMAMDAATGAHGYISFLEKCPPVVVQLLEGG